MVLLERKFRPFGHILESNVFSKAVISSVTWGVCTIIGLTGPGGPLGPGGPYPPGGPGDPPPSGGPPSPLGGPPPGYPPLPGVSHSY